MSFDEYLRSKASTSLNALLMRFSEAVKRDLDEPLIALVNDLSRAAKDGRPAGLAAEFDGLRRSQQDIEAIRAEADARVQRAEAEAQAQIAFAQAQIQSAQEAVRTAHARSVEARLESGAELYPAGLAPHSPLIDRLLAGFRTIDARASVTGVLDALVEQISSEFSRTILFVVEGGRLVAWRSVGFEGHAAMLNGREIPLSVESPLTRAVSTAATIAFADADITGLEGIIRCGVALPLIMDRQVIAVAYADDAPKTSSPGDEPARGSDPGVAEIFARHASRCLSSLATAATTHLPPPSD